MKDRASENHQEQDGATVNGERVGSEQLFREHAEFIAAFLHRLGVRGADVEDAVQEVFVVAHQKGGYRPGPAKPRSWLAAIALRIARSARRAHARRREDYDDRGLDSLIQEKKSPSEAAEIAE